MTYLRYQGLARTGLSSMLQPEAISQNTLLVAEVDHITRRELQEGFQSVTGGTASEIKFLPCRMCMAVWPHERYNIPDDASCNIP